jgi:hypothetical protein
MNTSCASTVVTVLTTSSHLTALKNGENNDTNNSTTLESPDSFIKDSMHIRQNKRNILPQDLDPSVVHKEEEEDDEWCEETEHETESETSSKSDDEIQGPPDYDNETRILEPPPLPVTSTKASALASLAEPSQAVTTTSSKQQQQQLQDQTVPSSSSYWASSVCHNKNNAKKNNKNSLKKKKKSVAFATNTDGSVICQTRLVSIHEQYDCWYRPEEKLAMQEHFSRVVLYYQSYGNEDDGNNEVNNQDNNNDDSNDKDKTTKKNDTTRRAFVEALAKLQKDAHKLTMPQTCQQLSTIALHTAQTRGLESYVLSDEFDYMRQKHLLRILMVQNQLEQQFGMYEERQNGGCTMDTKEESIDKVEDLIMNELSRTSLRWSVRSTQFARLIALLDKHAAQEALSSPWSRSSL